MNDEIKGSQTAEADKPTYGPEIILFTKHIDAIGDVLLGMVFAVQEITKQSQEKLTNFEDENAHVTETDGKRSVQIPNAQFREWKRLARRFEHFSMSRTLLPRSLLVSLISQYDAYLGRLLRTTFIRKPEILNGSEKKISFDALTQFSSIQAAREYILEKEVETVLRSSHAEQFKWMESAFGLPLTKDLASWPSFIELTERRNLFVHTDGIVSSQYIAVCKLHKCSISEELKEGDPLGVPQAYFEAAHQCIYEIGVKLGHVLWRKMFPEERALADSNFTRLTYDLMENGKYDLAIRLLDFACSEFKKFSTEGSQLTLIVNRAQSYKWKGDDERCKKIMKAVDWSAKADQFRLADAVLAEDWPKAGKVMRRIGKEGSVDQTDYRDWPLFRDFRKQTAFLEAYEQIFGSTFPEKSEVETKALPKEVQPGELRHEQCDGAAAA
jgi:hypothetical protein